MDARRSWFSRVRTDIRLDHVTNEMQNETRAHDRKWYVSPAATADVHVAPRNKQWFLRLLFI